MCANVRRAGTGAHRAALIAVATALALAMLLSGCAVFSQPTTGPVSDPPDTSATAPAEPEPPTAPEPAHDPPDPEQEPAPDPEPIQQTITVTVVGDLLMHSPLFQTAWTGEGYDFRPLFAPVKDELSRAHLTIANLETSLGGPERGFSGYPVFNTPDELLDALTDSGVDTLITANNHSLDSGVDGLKRGLAVIAEHGLTAIGTQAEPDDPRFLLLDLDIAPGTPPVRVALLAYTYGTNGIPVPEPHLVNLIDPDQIAADIAAARAAAPDLDLLLVAMHWGDEYQRQPNDWQRDLAAFLYAQGVDAVLGTHPHVVQPIEMLGADERGERGPVPVIYSTGNFVSNQDKYSRDGRTGYEVLPIDAAALEAAALADAAGIDAPALGDAALTRMSEVLEEMAELLGPTPVYVHPDPDD